MNPYTITIRLDQGILGVLPELLIGKYNSPNAWFRWFLLSVGPVNLDSRLTTLEAAFGVEC